MKRHIVQTTAFEKEIISLIAKRKLAAEDFEDLKKIADAIKRSI